MSNGAKIGIAVVVAVVAFGGAFLLFGGGHKDDSSTNDMGSSAETTCMQAATDTAYAVSVDGTPTTGGKSVTLVVARDGQPVTGANVCMSTTMTGMPMGITGTGKETSPGHYQVDADMGMAGKLTGTVVVAETGRPAGSAPIVIEVK